MSVFFGDAAQEEMMTTPLISQHSTPGSRGEHDLQARYGTRLRAEAFYTHQMLSYLNPQMRAFIARQEMFFLSTADGHGECDVSFRAGVAGFVHVLNEKILVYPEYRGNGVLASLGNIAENPHAGLLFIDFFRDKIGLHVNGSACILSNEALLAFPEVSAALRAAIAETSGRRPERWVLVTVEEAYIHCSKHVPRLKKAGEEVRHWGSDDVRAKGGDYFKAKSAPRSDHRMSARNA
jgi:predicted pyridoxine 5'-phosphate oxidase superfamily flavin-nucleotide-binding protein